MNDYSIENISPIDGRYHKKTKKLSGYFSEFALIQYRIRVEIEYLIQLGIFLPDSSLRTFSNSEEAKLRDLYLRFTPTEALKVKQIETQTNHDVKAVEYYIKDQMDHLGLADLKEWVHFGLTSQDINNTSQPMMLKGSYEEVIRPMIKDIIGQIEDCSRRWKRIPMLARTHGQPASPTLLGKEIYVFAERLKGQLALLDQIPFTAKFGGATGNFNAHHISFPDLNWVSFSDHFVNNILLLRRISYTTQIEPYDYTAAFCDGLRRIHTILIDFCRDIWSYISMNYFKQKINELEVGSSAMPHKVNPIDFENAEGNLGLSNAILGYLSDKLPISRLQRDLTDSTVMRNMGVPLGHGVIAYDSILRGISKLQLHQQDIDRDLDDNWAVIAEAIQTVLRAKGYENPYELLKALTRKNETIRPEHIQSFIQQLAIDEETKTFLMGITPFNYVGCVDVPE